LQLNQATSPPPSPRPPAAHPAVWRASELARGVGATVETGYAALSAALPGGGWPAGNLIELLLPRPGVGELRLLYPALRKLETGRIVLLQPPHLPTAPAWDDMGIAPSRLLWLRARRDADALWAAEQVLRSGSCGALLFWQAQLATPALRRLHLAAQSGATLFCLLRPLACAANASPAMLRLALGAADGGVRIAFLKRRGPQRDSELFLPLQPTPLSPYRHATLDRPAPAPAGAGSILPALVS
jgi:protein ImuA